jgi:hypothetical protein
MFAWSSQQPFKQQQSQQKQQQQQQPDHQQQQQQPQQQAEGAAAWPPLLRTGAVVLAMQGPVEMELLIAQVSHHLYIPLHDPLCNDGSE